MEHYIWCPVLIRFARARLGDLHMTDGRQCLLTIFSLSWPTTSQANVALYGKVTYTAYIAYHTLRRLRGVDSNDVLRCLATSWARAISVGEEEEWGGHAEDYQQP